jgi:hypothetical protein
VERLAEAELIEAVETERQGRRPERTIYRITGAGRRELAEWLDEAISEPRNEYPRFGAALVSMHNRDPATAGRLLADRALRLSAEIAALAKTLEGLAGQEAARAHVIEWEYVLAMRQAELAWVRAIIEDIGMGRLAWEHRLSEDRDHNLEDG